MRITRKKNRICPRQKQYTGMEKFKTSEIFSIFRLKIHIFRLQIRIFRLQIYIFSLKIENKSYLLNFWKGLLRKETRAFPLFPAWKNELSTLILHRKLHYSITS